MLRVMRDHSEAIAPAFAALFKRNPMARVLRFLDEQAAVVDILRIMASLPAALFVGTALAMMAEQAVGVGKEGKARKQRKGEFASGKPWPV
jgi:hypothetical protein